MENIPEEIKQHVEGSGLSHNEKKILLDELNTYFKLRRERIERKKRDKGSLLNG
ncbi:hypothetical protein P4345_25785 [Cytobacillus horneckiae]|uniref:hypothetical protein n=1 Tax=Cytobacillus horneckiae TaxID=549687 RepID=UPI002E205EA6|nr:hypothetical protein [Cytobacillus horneckiae]